MFTIIVHAHVVDELKVLPPVLRAKMVRLIDKLELDAPSLREPDSKPIRDGLFELRTMGTVIARGLYAYRKGKKVYLLRVFIKKTWRTPPAEIQLAFIRLEEMQREEKESN